MRAYEVKAVEGDDDELLGRRFGATQADARAKRDELMEKFGVKKSACTIEEVEIPMAKAELLEFINELASENDAVEE